MYYLKGYEKRNAVPDRVLGFTPQFDKDNRHDMAMKYPEFVGVLTLDELIRWCFSSLLE